MYDAHIGFCHDGEFEIHQVIVIFVNAARQRILNRHDGARGAALFQTAKQVLKPHTGKNFHVSSAKLAGGFLAEDSALALDSNDFRTAPHRLTPSHRRTSGSAIPIRSRTRSTLWSTMSITVCGL